MKKKITRIWGIGLVIVLAASLLLLAAPVSAGTLSWGSEDLPDELAPGTDIVDMAVSGDGAVIYVAAVDSTLPPPTSSTIYRSTNGGESWTSIVVEDVLVSGETAVKLDVGYIAVTPDDPNYIAVCGVAVAVPLETVPPTDPMVYISDDAGANWDSLGVAGIILPAGAVNDLAISVEKGGNHFVAVAGGTGGLTPIAQVWTYEIGAIGSDWENVWMTSGTPANDVAAYAVAFSPNFYSDQAMVAVSFDPGVDNEINFSMYSFNTDSWNEGPFIDFPKNLRQGSDSLVTMESASIAMAPDYLGSDDSMRIVFVGLAVNGALNDFESEGIFRLDDTDVEVLKDEEAIHSIVFDGSLLVAGHSDEITIYRSTDPLADDPSISGSTSTKEPGGDNLVLVGIAGSDVVVGTSGDESAFAYSEDNGKSFNDLSMIDTALTVLSDVAVTADGSMVYLVTCDAGTEMSVWMLDDRWERIYSNQTAGPDYIIRLAPDDSDVIYLAEAGGTSVYFSSSGGQDKWHTRIYKETTIVDLAVETEGDTIYVLTDGGYVSKSTNRGFVWDAKKSSKLSTSSMIASIGEDMVVAGSFTDGRVAYSTDGNATWTKLSDEDFDDGGPVQVTATGLADGDFVIAASGDGVYSWELGEADSWDDISPSAFSGNVTTGIGIWNGVLYALASDGAASDSILARTLTPTSDDPTWSTKVIADATFDAMPTALRMSAGSDITKLWAIDTEIVITPQQALFSYKDSLALASVASRAPADGADIPFNTVSGDASQIIFSWTCPSDKVTLFDFEIATDTDFDETVVSLAIEKSSGTWDEGDVISQIVGPGASDPGNIAFMADTTYYWKVRVNAAGPVRSAWSPTRSFSTGSLPEILPPVVIQQPPAPVISVPPAPAITITPPEIILPAPPPAPPEIVIPAAPEPTPPVPSWAIYAIIIIGAVLVIALIVLIMRTRRPV